MFDKDLSNSSIFSLKAKLEIEYIITNNRTSGTEVRIEALFFIKSM